MVGMYPWGGLGANPQPARFQGEWNLVKNRFQGGFPYSEGIYEDLNKVIFAQFYWNPDTNAYDTVRDYLAYELSSSVVTEMVEVSRFSSRTTITGGGQAERGTITSQGMNTGGSHRKESRFKKIRGQKRLLKSLRTYSRNFLLIPETPGDGGYCTCERSLTMNSNKMRINLHNGPKKPFESWSTFTMRLMPTRPLNLLSNDCV